MEIGIERIEQEHEDWRASLTTSGDGRSNAFAPEIADQTFGPLRDFTVEDNEADSHCSSA